MFKVSTVRLSLDLRAVVVRVWLWLGWVDWLALGGITTERL